MLNFALLASPVMSVFSVLGSVNLPVSNYFSKNNNTSGCVTGITLRRAVDSQDVIKMSDRHRNVVIR